MNHLVLNLRNITLFILNMASTLLTLFTGMRENSVMVYLAGRYDNIRYRLEHGFINYKHIRDDLLNVSKLPDLQDVGKNWRIISSPTRSPSNLAQDRSVCLRVNSMNATEWMMNFDDFWGKDVRREQLFLFSISPPNCRLMNLQPSWVRDNCTALHDNDQSKCFQFILDNFDELYNDRPIQVSVAVDFGAPGRPFLKCLGRPMQQFEFMADLMVQQQYWADASYTVEIQSSDCFAQPLLRDQQWRWGLFEVVEKNQEAHVVTAINQKSTAAAIVVYIYGLVSLFLIANGVLRILLPTQAVWYVPAAKRFMKDKVFRFLFPSMSVLAMVPTNEDTVVSFVGTRIIGSDYWMNHWLYIYLSIAEALMSIRIMYVGLEMGSWLLSNKANVSNFVFICSALTRITWLMCLLHTILRYWLKFVGLVLRVMGILSDRSRTQYNNFVDGASCFMSFKVYSVTLCLILAGFLKLHGATTFQKRSNPSIVPNHGGTYEVHEFWETEIMGDLVVIFGFITLCGIGIGVLLMLTPYRRCVDNALVRLIQRRYFLVGWDVFVVMEALGMNPFDPRLVKDGVALTNCSFGSVVQVLYTAGPSGFLHLVGDQVFDGKSQKPIIMHYAPKRAAAMGLYSTIQGPSAVLPLGSPGLSGDRSSILLGPQESKLTSSSVTPKIRKSIFEMPLRMVGENVWGQLLVVDSGNPGSLQLNAAGTMNEFVAEDVLSSVTGEELGMLLGRNKRVHVM